VLARIIEPGSKLDSARVLEEAGISAPSYRPPRLYPPEPPRPGRSANSALQVRVYAAKIGHQTIIRCPHNPT
jgi:hypothetical protein